MNVRASILSVTGPTGIRHSVEVTAEGLYEAAILGVLVAETNIGPEDRFDLEVLGAITTNSSLSTLLRVYSDDISKLPSEVKNELPNAVPSRPSGGDAKTLAELNSAAEAATRRVK